MRSFLPSLLFSSLGEGASPPRLVRLRKGSESSHAFVLRTFMDLDSSPGFILLPVNTQRDLRPFQCYPEPPPSSPAAPWVSARHQARVELPICIHVLAGRNALALCLGEGLFFREHLTYFLIHLDILSVLMTITPPKKNDICYFL